MIKADWKPIIFLGGGGGALLGLWIGLWIVGFLLLWENGLLNPGISIPIQHADYLRIPTEETLLFLGRVIHMDMPSQPSYLLGWLASIGAVSGAVVASASRLTSLDPRMIGFRSFRWAVRSTLTWPSVLSCASSILVVGVTIATENEILMVVVIAVVAAYSYLFLPFSVCRPRVAVGNIAARWWLPCWPGLRVFAVFVALEISGLLSGYETFMDWPLVWIAALAVSFVIDLVAPLLQGTLLMSSAATRPWEWRRVLRWKMIGPWIATSMWWLLIPGVFLGPFIFFYLWIWKVLPVLASVLESQGHTLPYVYQLLANFLFFLGKFGGLLLMFPSSLFVWFSIARLVVEADMGFNATPQ